MMKNKLTRVILILLVISLLVVMPVSASWFSEMVEQVFKKTAKSETTSVAKSAQKAEQTAVKQTDNIVSESKTAQKTEDISTSVNKYAKINSKSLDSLVEAQYQKETKYKGYMTTQEQTITRNRIKGEIWQSQFVKPALCSKTACAETFSTAQSYMHKGSVSWTPIKTRFVLTKDSETRKFIQEYIDNDFNRKPDFLEVYTDTNGNIKEIKIIDAKVSQTAVDTEQDLGFTQLCTKAKAKGIGCNVEYAMPKSQTAGLVTIGCLASFLIPDPATAFTTDIVCLVIA